MNQQNSKSLAMMLINSENPLRSEKSPLKKKIFTKFITVSTSKISKIFKKNNSNSFLSAQPQFHSPSNQLHSNNPLIRIQESNQKQQTQHFDQQKETRDCIEQKIQDVKQSFIQYLNDDNQAAEITSSGYHSDQSTYLSVDQVLELTKHQKNQENYVQKCLNKQKYPYFSPHHPQNTRKDPYQANFQMQPTHDDENSQIPLPKAQDQKSNPKAQDRKNDGKKDSQTDQPKQTNSNEPFCSFQVLSTPKQKQQNFIYTKFQSLFARTIPEEFEEESSNSMFSQSIYSEMDKKDHIQQFNTQWKRLSVKSLHLHNQAEQLNQQETVFMSNLNSKISHSPSPTQETSHQSHSIIQKPKKASQQTLNFQKVSKQTLNHPKHRKQNQGLIYVEEQYQNGGKYCGYMKNKERNGFGKFFYKNGGYYEGLWRDNAMNGQGVLYYDNGRVAYDGQWYQSQFHGKGKVYNDSAKEMNDNFDYRDFNENIQNYWQHYEGELSHDTKVGYGKIFMSNGEYFEGTFSDDIVHGQGKFYSFNNGGEVVRGVWNQGILVKVLQIIPRRKIQFIQTRINNQNQVPNCQRDYQECESAESVILSDEQKVSDNNPKNQGLKNRSTQNHIKMSFCEKQGKLVEENHQQGTMNSIQEMGTIAISQELQINELDSTSQNRLDQIYYQRILQDKHSDPLKKQDLRINHDLHRNQNKKLQRSFSFQVSINSNLEQEPDQRCDKPSGQNKEKTLFSVQNETKSQTNITNEQFITRKQLLKVSAHQFVDYSMNPTF